MKAAFSILLPTRNRPANLRASVASIFNLAADPSCIEIIARLDKCDPSLQESMRILQQSPYADQIHVGVAPRVGYARCQEMWNWLAEVARGDWLFIWNDDLEMQTPGWDALLREAPPFSIQWPRRDITVKTDYTVPVVGRPIYEAIGHLCVNAFADAWLADVSAYAGTSIVRDEVVFHHHRLTDTTAVEAASATDEWHKFSQEEQRALRVQDRNRVVAAAGWSQRHDGWKLEPIEPQLDYLNLGAPAKPTAYVIRGRT